MNSVSLSFVSCKTALDRSGSNLSCHKFETKIEVHSGVPQNICILLVCRKTKSLRNTVLDGGDCLNGSHYADALAVGS